MTKLAKLEKAVKDLYLSGNPNRDEWADWLYPNHVIVVADYATELSARFNADNDLARAAALLHDIADAVTSRFDKTHEAQSLDTARQILTNSGYNQEEITLVVDDAIRYHSCHGDEKPASIEGRILSTADTMAHLMTDYYVYATWAFGNHDRTLERLKSWVLKKIERELYFKVHFDEVREELRPDYDRIKELFSR